MLYRLGIEAAVRRSCLNPADGVAYRNICAAAQEQHLGRTCQVKALRRPRALRCCTPRKGGIGESGNWRRSPQGGLPGLVQFARMSLQSADLGQRR